MGKVEALRRRYVMGLRFDAEETPGAVKTFLGKFVDEGVQRRNEMLTRAQWWRAVTLTLRNDNQARGVPEGATTHIEEAARVIRNDIWGPAAKELGFLTERVRQKGLNPMTYVFRVYDVTKIRARQDEFRGVMMSDVLKQWNAKYREAPNPEQLASLNEMVDAWIDGILSTSWSRSAPNLAEVMLEGKGSLGRAGRKRVVDVSDEVLEPWLKSDLRDVMNAYMHTRLRVIL